jgi:hypothetical protein
LSLALGAARALPACGDDDAGGDADCAGLGGTCNEAIWDLCGPGTEPYSVEDTLDCGYGLCCVPAEGDFACNESEGYMDCVPAEACADLGYCWDVAEGDLACEEGRSCCTFICD